ncbi:MAG: bifunctional alpha/beta hydrolase/OsmC family protein [Paracoccaceae bacterium]
MPTETLSFENSAGHKLAARLERPTGPLRATALFAHCFACTKQSLAARRIARRLAHQGIAVLSFDFTGLGQSEGDFAHTTFTSNLNDLTAAAEALAARGMAPALLVGHSLGGAAVLAAAGRIATARAVVTIGAPFEPAHVAQNFAGALAQIEGEGSAAIRLGAQTLTIGREFLRDIAAARLEPALTALGKALLVLHAPRDSVVGIDNASRIFQAARHPKSFVTLDSADHLLTDPADAEYAADVIATWAERYLALARPAPPPGAPEGVTRVAEADPGGFLQDIQSGPHHLRADEPLAYGGTDLGPSPYQLLAAGLGACTAMTIRMYARRKGWPLAHVRVDVSHDKMHGQDCKDCNGRDGRIDVFRREIALEGELDGDQRQRLLQIADRCPVHRTLEASSRIDTVLADPA